MATALLDRDPVIGVITNPNSKKNRRRHDRVAELQAIVGNLGLVRQTPSTEAIGPVIDEFAERGVDFWVSDGGDGAFFWMLNKARETLRETPHGLASRLHYALPTNGGTIDYVARRAGVRGKAEDILKKLVSIYRSGSRVQESIVPSLVFSGVQEKEGALVPFEKIGFASAIAGVGNRFFDKYYRARIPGPKVIVEVVSKTALSFVADQVPFAGRLVPSDWISYGRDVLETMPARAWADGEEIAARDFTTISVGAFKINLGGVMKLFPRAGKGKMHISAGNPTTWEMIAALPRMATGRQLRSPRLWDDPGSELIVEATTDELLRPNIDGEFVDSVRRIVVRPGPKFRIPRIDCKGR